MDTTVNWSPDAIQQAREHLKTLLPVDPYNISGGKAAMLYFLLESSRSDALGFVRVFCITPTGERQLTELTLAVSKVTGLPMTERNGRFWLKVKRIGYDRTEYVADKLWKAMELPEGMPSSNLFYRYTL